MAQRTLIFLCIAISVICLQANAAKPIRNEPQEAVAAPEVFSVKIDYINGLIIVGGVNLDPATVNAEIAGVALSIDGASTDSTLYFPFTPSVSAAVDELGNYVLSISNDGGTFTLSTFIPLGLTVPDEPPPPGEDCPCSTEWDQKSSASSPNGFAGQTPYCDQDSGDFVTVQFYDTAVGNYWVLWTEWTGSTGYCELYIDGPNRTLSSEVEFNACADYLRNIVTVWGSQGNDCIL